MIKYHEELEFDRRTQSMSEDEIRALFKDDKIPKHHKLNLTDIAMGVLIIPFALVAILITFIFIRDKWI